VILSGLTLPVALETTAKFESYAVATYVRVPPPVSPFVVKATLTPVGAEGGSSVTLEMADEVGFV
jgi:hypothetical protein